MEVTVGHIDQTHFKECTPQITVGKIQKILQKYNIVVDEIWGEDSPIGSCSLRIVFPGTDIGTNGKGIDKDYARASAYGEFMERMQNQYLYSYRFQNIYGNRTMFLNDTAISIETLLEENAFTAFYFRNMGAENFTYNEKISFLKKYLFSEVLNPFDEKPYTGREFYSMRQRKKQILCVEMYDFLYGSNGMASGNSIEEALIQAISEIYERFVQGKILENKICLPDVPEHYIANFPEVEAMYHLFQKIPGYKIQMKDASLGGRYPVAVLIVCCKNSGHYGIKTGAHPDFGIAMERTLTEAFQGMGLSQFANTSSLDFEDNQVNTVINKYNSYKIAGGQYPVSIFEDEADYAFTPVEDVKGKSNKEILGKMLKEILEEGYDILFRDVSFLGFPSVQVIIPGMSEVVKPEPETIRAQNSLKYCSFLMRSKMDLETEDIKILLNTCQFWKESIFQNQVKSYYNLPLRADFLGEKDGEELLLLICICFFALGRKQEAYQEISYYCRKKRMFYDDWKNEKVLCMKDCMGALSSEVPVEKAKKILGKFYEEELLEHTFELLGHPSRLLKRVFPGTNCPNCTNCFFCKSCDHKYFQELYGFLMKAQNNYSGTIFYEEWQKELGI